MERERYRRRHLPHWDMPGAAYFITSCLEGSIPAQGLLEVIRYRAELQNQIKPATISDREWETRQRKLEFVQLEKWLDLNPANQILRRPDAATIVVDAMYHFAGIRYDLLAYVVMPSHFHWVFQPRDEWTCEFQEGDRSAREQIMYSLRRFTANQCNQLLSVQGTFWQAETYDHWIRDSDELERVIHYVEENPVKAGLDEEPNQWPFSSASVRSATATEIGAPLPAQPIRRSGFRS